jgi:adenylosuccinate synthase
LADCVIDLGFGDGGKGRLVDALSRWRRAACVIRFNGGAQAGHNVVLPDGRHHCFSQWGAGSFLPGVQTLLAAPVVVHPGALAVEAERLERVGVADPFARLHIDARCRVTTPWLQTAGRLREAEQQHGSCGVGFGETVRLSLEHPELSLRWADLLHPARAMQKLHAQHALLARSWPVESFAFAEPWLLQAHSLARRCPPRLQDEVRAMLLAQRPWVFEGAQGLLLDETHGFAPHTSWSDTRPAAARAVLAELGLPTSMRVWGALRSYLTRHGAGPLPTEDPALDARLPEPHNVDGGLQGRFRRGHPDAVLLRHALRASGPLDGLVLGHADALERAPLRWCEGYAGDAGDAGMGTPLAPEAAALQGARPIWSPGTLTLPALLDRLQTCTDLPVRAHASGPTATDLSAAL